MAKAFTVTNSRTHTEPINLRQADWRFLLPCPKENSFQHLVLLGGSSGLPERLVEIGLARRVSCEIPQSQSADALVVLHKANVDFKDAARCLAPGGALYYEVDRRSRSKLLLSPGRIHRLMREMGFTPTGIYWAIPNFTQCKRYLPLDVPAALRWYLTTLFPAMTPVDRLFEFGVRTLKWIDGDRLNAICPCYCLTANAGSNQDTAPSLLGHPQLPTPLKRSGLRPFLLTSGYDDGSRIVMLPFSRDSAQPLGVLKVSRIRDFNSHTEREQLTLVNLRAFLNESMRKTIPQPLGVLRYGNLAVAVESYAKGHTLVVSSGRWRAPISQKIADLRVATNWLSRFHLQAQIGRLPWGESELCKWVEMPLYAYIRAFGATASEERLFAAVRERSRALIGTCLPIVWQHNDFGPWHVYRDDREITVIDWEFGHDRQVDRLGPALCDLIYFVTHWNYIVRQLRTETAQLRGFRQLFIGHNIDDRAGAIQQVIMKYMEELDIDRRYWPVLLAYTWIQRALDHFKRHRALGNMGTDHRFRNRYVDYLGILADHTEKLFSRSHPITQ